MTSTQASADFYDLLSDDYDVMTGDKSRWTALKEAYRQILEGLDTPKTLDAGCGTGGEALLIAELGAEVVGVDQSERMIESASAKATETGLKARFQQASLTTLAGVESGFGLTLCRGNTLPHLLEVEDLKNALVSLRDHTDVGGVLILSWLNYGPILKERKRIIGVTSSGETTYVRFYDFVSDTQLTFNILKVTHASPSDPKPVATITSTTLRPWSADDVGMLLRQTGWGELEIAADLYRNEFDLDNSRDVTLFAVKE